MRVGFLGFGLMGQRRAKHLAPDDEVAAIYDPGFDYRAGHDAKILRAHVNDLEAVLNRSEAVVVATPHDLLAPLTFRCIEAGKHVLVEKPCGRTVEELLPVVSLAAKRGVSVVPGFTLRHYPGIREAQEMCVSGQYGKALYLRATYGHGGKPADWHLDAAKGGGELLDQGTHLIDLSRFFLGKVHRVSAAEVVRWVYEPVEDNAFLLLRHEWGALSQLHASWTEWKPIFRLEVVCEQARIEVEGLGGGYGHQRLRRRNQKGDVVFEKAFGDARDESLYAEWASFKHAVSQGLSNLEDAVEVLKVTSFARK